MKHLLFFLTIFCLLTACSSSPILDTTIKHYSGGQRAGNSVSFFWYTEKSDLPETASDAVFSGNDGEYRTSYYWSQGKLQEIVRKGEKLNQQGQLVPFSLQLRFTQTGEAVYQLYRIDGSVLPVHEEQIHHYQEQAADIIKITKGRGASIHRPRLIQGYWDGETFESCNGKEYSSIEFNQTLPSFVVNRLSSLNNYLAVSGSIKGSTLQVDKLLVLTDDDHDCMKPVDLRKE
ncbi:DUF1481 domain-containing protein [Vibrio salinus]|uniref:DUF1481 domain-containing protein n=1 Tax=Vibrio salinus TaxID=2899784 RepID=UPI001E61D414|nr:DUF1481 domain-containing protein [Vibrio salinus]MCE0493817.1 DUF1481 domain-containing protein [Vibrio salinus]